MKKLLICLSAIAIIACKEEAPKDYVTFSGKITNQTSDSLLVRSRTFTKKIDVNADGTFSDTLKVETGMYNVSDGNEGTNMFLKNGFDINMTIDTKQFDETVKYTGNGAEHSNFLAANALKQEKMLDIDALVELTPEALEVKMTGFEKELTEFYDANKDVDTSITNSMRKDIKPMLDYYKGYVGDKIAMKRDLPVGSDSPVFENYVNVKGGTTSLSDLKGKYTYIDVWATWCGPCKAEIPSLKTLEHDYAGKKINFVSMSIDDGAGYKADTKEASAALAKEGWRKMIADKELGGVQILAPDGWKSKFVRDYRINGIPRFLLIDPNGKIVNIDAPRPSSSDIRELFDSLDI